MDMRVAESGKEGFFPKLLLRRPGILAGKIVAHEGYLSSIFHQESSDAALGITSDNGTFVYFHVLLLIFQ
jgi:hypothetical protein